ncbi:MAG: MbcA/ParS/Xre antitoxin family protein [Opitutaceae bacterium]|nr:MbcA/ParS/Xre antitoxin family protein [Opitutaceae bacterium]
MDNNPDKQIKGDEARRQIIAAAVGEIRRREGLISKLEQLDESVIVAALRTFESPGGAAEWLICPAYGIGGAIPVDVAETAEGRGRVLWVLGCIQYNIPI